MKRLRRVVLLLALAPSTAYGATFTVNNSTDTVDLLPGDGVCDAGGGQCTLRAAVQEANAFPGDDIISFAATLDGIPIVLTIPPVDSCPPFGCTKEADAAGGDLDITENLTIIGNGAGSTILQGGLDLASSVDGVFEVISQVCNHCITASISGVTIRYAGGPAALQHGGFVINRSALITTITDSVISDNRGSGIWVNDGGNVLVDRVTFARNVADQGGGFFAFGSGDQLLSITNSTFNDNTADDGAGGGLGGALYINVAEYDATSPTVFNSTFSGNTAADGCATYTLNGVLRLYNVTVADNCSPGSGAAAVVASANGEGIGTTAWRNSVIVSSPGAQNCGTGPPPASITSEGYNLSSDASCGFVAAGDVQNANPLLAPLASNGGPTQTHLPLPGSPAIDTGTPANCPPTDQRGFVRPVDGNGDAVVECDKGSVEVGAPGPGLPNSAIQGTKWDDANSDGVKQPGEAGVAGIQICLFPTTPSTCTITGAGGTYLFLNVTQGTYHVYERLPAGRINTTPRSQQVVVPAGSTVSGVDFGNRVLPPFPGVIVDVNTAWTSGGTPVVPNQRPLVVRVTPACIVLSATATLTGGAGTRTQSMTFAGGNTWQTTFAPFLTGVGHLTVNVSCVGGATEVFDGDIIFVDPSGTILDSCTAQPLAGATVTLLKNDPYLSPTYVIPDPGETIPTNNPEITLADGLYAWDVVPGRWKVQASKAGYGTVTTSAFDVPPPVLGLDISLTPIAGCNTPPSANNDAYSTGQGTTLYVPAPGVLVNDTDAESNTLTAILVSNAVNGNVLLAADGSFTYTPNPGFHGTDSFTYKANDGTADSNVATVTITVNAVNRRPVARDDAYSTRKNKVLVVRAPGVLANDTDLDGSSLTAVLVHGPAHGTLFLHRDGSFIYKPKGGFVGKDTFTYKASDGVNTSNTATVTINVTRKHEGEKDDEEEGDREEHGQKEKS